MPGGKNLFLCLVLYDDLLFIAFILIEVWPFAVRTDKSELSNRGVVCILFAAMGAFLKQGEYTHLVSPSISGHVVSLELSPYTEVYASLP